MTSERKAQWVQYLIGIMESLEKHIPELGEVVLALAKIKQKYENCPDQLELPLCQ